MTDARAAEIAGADAGFVERVAMLPLGGDEYLPPNWLRLEALARYRVLKGAGVRPGETILEVGCGAHAIATVGLGHLAGPGGRVVAFEKARWTYFDEIIRAAELSARVRPVQGDARTLPFKRGSFDLAAAVHSVRSFSDEATIVRIFREMLCVAPRIIVAESLPVARNAAQEAHLGMYNLREEIFEAVLGARDDLHYFPLNRLEGFIVQAGGRVTDSLTIETKLPHYLAFIARDYLSRIPSPARRDDLRRRWDAAYQRLVEHGEEHPPVGVIRAVRREA
jgi:ubiE/COQ5 methyltransferase family